MAGLHVFSLFAFIWQFDEISPKSSLLRNLLEFTHSPYQVRVRVHFSFFLFFVFILISLTVILAFIMPGIMMCRLLCDTSLCTKTSDIFPLNAIARVHSQQRPRTNKIFPRPFEIIFCQKPVDKAKIEVTISLQCLKGI